MISSGKQYQNFEYYAKDPVYTVEDGRFIGGLAAELGFTEINADNMAKLQAGQDATGKQVVETAGKGGVEHNPGKDYTFSIDKSISILRFSAETPETIKSAIDEAMRAAGDKFVETAIKEGMVTWREHSGDDITHHAIENTDQIAAKSFLQATSRNNDPDLHVHIAFMNMAKVGDGYKTIKFDGIHKKDAKAFLDQTVKNEFYQVLEQKLGKDLSDVIEKNKVDGTLSVAGIGKELIEQFSTRQTEIKEALAELKQKYPSASEGELTQIANKATRQEKNLDFTKEQLETKLQPAAEAVKEAVNAILVQQTYEIRGIDEDKLKADVKMVSEGLGKKEIYSSVNKLYLEVLKQDSNYTYEAVKEAVNSSISIELQFRTVKDKEGVEIKQVATRENIEAERHVQAFFENGKKQGFGIDKETVNNAISVSEKKQGFEFAPDQKNSIEMALTGTDKASIIVGVAGAGKTTMFSTINEIAKNNNIQVVGFSNNGSQAETLMRETGIKSQTIKSFTEQTERQDNGMQVFDKTLVVVDESSMQGVQDTKALLEGLSKRYGNFKAIFVGDKHQIGSISAGKVLGNAINSAAEKTMLENIYRQKDENLKGIIYDFYKELNSEKAKNGEIDGKDIVNKLIDGGYIKTVGQGQENKEAIRSYIDAVKNGAEIKDIAVIVRTNKTKDEIDNGIREELLTGKELTLGTLKKENIDDINKFRAEAYMRGDIISFRKNEFKEVVSVDKKDNSIDVRGFSYVPEKEKGVEIKTIDGKQFINLATGKDGVKKEYEVRKNENGNISYYVSTGSEKINVNDEKRKNDINKMQKYTESEIKLRTGEKVMFTQNIKMDSSVYEKIKYTKDNRKWGQAIRALAGDYGLKSMVASLEKTGRTVDGAVAILKDKKIDKTIEKAKKEGEKYKEWQIGNSRGVIIEHKNKKEVVNGLQATFIGKSGTVYKFDLGKDKDGNRRTLKLNSADKKEAQALRNIEYAYAITTEKAQGLGVKNVITVENTKKNANQNLVDISRTVKELKIIVSENETVKKDKDGNSLKVKENGKEKEYYKVDKETKKETKITKEKADKEFNSAIDKSFSAVQNKTTSIRQQNQQNEQNRNTLSQENRRETGSVSRQQSEQKSEKTGYEQGYNSGRSR